MGYRRKCSNHHWYCWWGCSNKWIFDTNRLCLMASTYFLSSENALKLQAYYSLSLYLGFALNPCRFVTQFLVCFWYFVLIFCLFDFLLVSCINKNIISFRFTVHSRFTETILFLLLAVTQSTVYVLRTWLWFYDFSFSFVKICICF